MYIESNQIIWNLIYLSLQEIIKQWNVKEKLWESCFSSKMIFVNGAQLFSATNEDGTALPLSGNYELCALILENAVEETEQTWEKWSFILETGSWCYQGS